MRTWARRWIPCLLVALLLVPSLTAQSLWWDEGISLHLARLPWVQIIEDRVDNIHPPLYFLFLKVWSSWVGYSPFAARYFSVLPTILLPAAVYRFMRKRWGQRVARTTAFIVALSPLFLIYGQEVRAYAFLPLFWVVLLNLSWPDINPDDWRVRALALAVLEATFVLFHYTGLIAVAIAALLLLVGVLQTKSKYRMRTLWRIGWVSTVGTGLLLMPWIGLLVRAGFRGMGGQAGIANTLTEPVSAHFVIALLAVFHGVGLTQALSNPGLIRPLVLVGVGMIGGVYTLIQGSRQRRPALLLLAIWLLPFAVTPVIWSLSPQAHPRYLLPFALSGWLLLGCLIGGPWSGRWLQGLLLATTLVMAILGLRAYFQDPVYARSNVRGVAQYLRDHAEDGDVVFLPHTDWSLPQYVLGKA